MVRKEKYFKTFNSKTSLESVFFVFLYNNIVIEGEEKHVNNQEKCLFCVSLQQHCDCSGRKTF